MDGQKYQLDSVTQLPIIGSYFRGVLLQQFPIEDEYPRISAHFDFFREDRCLEVVIQRE